ncbi:MAG: histidinol-phosphate transaminase [Pseudomonadota bacterium]
MTRPRAHIAALAPYTLAKLDVPNGIAPLQLAQNESLRPPSPKALAAAAEAMAAAHLYPDPGWSALRHALASHHAIEAEDIVCGTGSLDLIGALARVYAGPDRAVLAPAHAYPFFRSAALLAGARFDTAPEAGGRVDIDALLDAVRADTGLLFLANPGNPTGTRVPKSALVELRQSLREDILLVIDEAYGEFADHLGERCFDMFANGNTAVLRSFSKAYGMAGCRVGWGLFPASVAAELGKVLSPNNLTAPAQAAARAALLDQSYLRETLTLTARIRDRAAKKLTEAGLSLQASLTNFLMIDFGSSETAQAADATLRAQGILLRRQAGAGLPQMLRMTIGPEDGTARAVAALIRLHREAIR